MVIILSDNIILVLQYLEEFLCSSDYTELSKSLYVILLTMTYIDT